MGIKSFMGRRAKEVSKKDYDAPILVEDYMSRKLVTFREDQSILEVMELFAKHHISGGPVMDDNGFLVGIISEADCMKQISESRYFNQPILDKSVERFMTKKVETIPHDMSIFDAAGIFDRHNRRRLPVMKDGLVVGQISRKDIVIAALKLSGQNWK
ncbi:CBS domain-containing protein [Eudoraea chungangensis]|uniref:CBS domain-containing protein n=1 Tax=Eudoraea chungangensis TaxID=1481905 RepID=UPI0023EADCA1|nr:CBS domain-containing protein [Eudoraea chungangensis]